MRKNFLGNHDYGKTNMYTTDTNIKMMKIENGKGTGREKEEKKEEEEKDGGRVRVNNCVS